eukprot:m.29890 g.29890  ORF g.29890 m.29890 type:complete len:189 (+) comp11982_c0_seq2:737-1303(+)
MQVQQIEPTLGNPLDLLMNTTMNRIEKNWSPLYAPSSDTIRLSRTIEPHEVVDCSLTSGVCWQVAVTSLATVFEKLRVQFAPSFHLGTNTIRLDDGRLLGLLHAVQRGKKHYTSLVYVLQAALPHRILAIGRRPLQLPLGQVDHGFVYTSSLFRAGNDVIVGYNVRDRTASLKVVPLKMLLDDLEVVS